MAVYIIDFIDILELCLDWYTLTLWHNTIWFTSIQRLTHLNCINIIHSFLINRSVSDEDKTMAVGLLSFSKTVFGTVNPLSTAKLW